MERETHNRIVARIIRFMRERGLTLPRLADESGIPEKKIAQLLIPEEYGVVGEFKIAEDELQRLAYALGRDRSIC